jgi:hypothetical protein
VRHGAPFAAAVERQRCATRCAHTLPGSITFDSRATSATVDVLLNELDVAELVQAGLKAKDDVDDDDDAPSKAGSKKRDVIRAATIDNFQGEEADIVIISLVRSNLQGNIGFLKEPDRVNVMLSRARNGMILFGNLETLCNARNKQGAALWNQLKGLLEGNIFSGLPIVCERHADVTNVVCRPDQFPQMSPEGGCIQRCGQPMKCGKHMCERSCHSGSHADLRCIAVTEQPCAAGHVQQFACHEAKSKPCDICRQIAEQKAKRERDEASLLAAQAKRRADYAVRLAKHEADVASERARIADLRDEQDRRLNLQRLEIETETLQKEQALIVERNPKVYQQKVAQLRRDQQNRIDQLTAAANVSLLTSASAVSSSLVPSTSSTSSSTSSHATPKDTVSMDALAPRRLTTKQQRDSASGSNTQADSFWTNAKLNSVAHIAAAMQTLRRLDRESLASLFSVPLSCVTLDLLLANSKPTDVDKAATKGIEMMRDGKSGILDAFQALCLTVCSDGQDCLSCVRQIKLS